MAQVKSIDITTPKGSNKMAHGGLGNDLVNNAFGNTGTTKIYGAIYVREDSVVDYENRLEAGERSVAGVSLLAGEWLHGEFHSVVVTSGSLRAYIKEYQVQP